MPAIKDVIHQATGDVFLVAFRDGRSTARSRRIIKADDGSSVAKVRVEDDDDAFVVRQKSSNTSDVAWDLVLHHQEPRYTYSKERQEQKRLDARRAHRIGDRVRRAREGRGWSLEDLARRTGMHRPNLHRLEAGKHLPSLETLERVAEALGLRVADLEAA